MIFVRRINIISRPSLEVESDVAVFEMKQEIVSLQAQIEDCESKGNLFKELTLTSHIRRGNHLQESDWQGLEELCHAEEDLRQVDKVR